jgi:hypothetical protein
VLIDKRLWTDIPAKKAARESKLQADSKFLSALDAR